MLLLLSFCWLSAAYWRALLPPGCGGGRVVPRDTAGTGEGLRDRAVPAALELVERTELVERKDCDNCR